MPASVDSEYRLYEYVGRSLNDLGWDPRNPSKGGDVYWQQETKHDPNLSNALEGSAPENVVVIPSEHGRKYWVIEVKSRSTHINKAVTEAEGYADKINSALPGQARFVSGVAGSPADSHYVVTKFHNGKEWKEISINGFSTTGFISKEQCNEFLRQNSPTIDKFEYSSKLFLKKANEINMALHSNEIPVGDRAKTMAALLLAMAKGDDIQAQSNAKEMIRTVNGNIEDTLEEHGKKELYPVLCLTPSVSKENHSKYRDALVETLQILRAMNIRSAINSGEDALGQFYETFLKYANGAKEMGIVLTPRHITRFASEVLLIHAKDRVFDPTCGTGGFLVSAMDYVKSRSKERKLWEDFQSKGLYGVEQRDDVYGLAVVNMIFRGDGKSNVYGGDCFTYNFYYRDGLVESQPAEDERLDGATMPFTKVLMNPPFKLKGNPEREFVDYALTQVTEQEGLLFAILPAVAIRGRGSHKTWRTELLKRHTLKAVVKFDTNLFYPVTEATYGIILEAHKPHEANQVVFWAELFDAKHTPRLSKMKSKEKAMDNLEEIKDELVKFMRGKPSKTSITDALVLQEIGKSLDFSPEPRLPRPVRTTHPGTKIRSLGMEIAKSIKGGGGGGTSEETASQKMEQFVVLRFVSKIHAAPISTLKDLEHGNVPVVSATQYNNGIEGWYSVPENKILENCVSISKTHNTNPCQAFYHPYKFSGIATAIYLELSPPLADNENAILYFCEAITRDNKSKFHYARPVDPKELQVYLPVDKDGEPDIGAMSRVVSAQIGKKEESKPAAPPV